jgi:hypothetical protein
MTSIPTYVPLIPLPAPITSGSGVQSYTDPNGDVWVAANGVNGGLWKRARDVIRMRVYRSAAYNYPTAASTVPWNAITYDPYGCFNSSTYAFVAPVAGLYRVDTQVCVAFTAANQYVGLQFGVSGYGIRVNNYVGLASNQYAQGHDVVQMNAGDTVAVTAYTSIALAMPASAMNASDQMFLVKYEGTG